MSTPRILVTNDDGIDSHGLHHLAAAMTKHGNVTIVAPDREFSGASAAIGALWEFEPKITRRHAEDFDEFGHLGGLGEIDDIWTVNGPPALCVLYARMGLFHDARFDLVVSGINPGANVGRSVYHSGTVGACLTGRNSGISGVAVSQMFPASFEGQAMAELVADQVWETASHVASDFVGAALATGLPDEPFVANINVPNLDLAEIKGTRRCDVGIMPPATMTTATLVPDGDHDDLFGVELSWGSTNEQNEPGTDARAVADGYVSLTYLSRLADEQRPDLDALATTFGATIS